MQISVINNSTKVGAQDFAKMVLAMNQQMRTQVAPLWGMTAANVLAAPAVGASRIYLFDSADRAGALGYHSQDREGRPYGKVFVDPVLSYGGKMLAGPGSVASILSHEVIELFVDPQCNAWAEAPDGKLYAYEACDPVENDTYQVVVDKVPVSVSNFVTPAWFDANPSPGDRFDWLGKLKAPFTMTKGGYVIYRSAGSEKSVFAASGELSESKLLGKKFPAARSARRGAAIEHERSEPRSGGGAVA